MLKLNAAALLILSAVAATGANATGLKGTDADYGVAVADSAASRTITVKPGAKYINVTNGETVSIMVGDQRFSWHVDTFPNQNVFDLSKIAPAGVQADGVQVYVARDPLLFGA